MNRIKTIIASVSVLALVAAVPVAARQASPRDLDNSGFYQQVEYTMGQSRPERTTIDDRSAMESQGSRAGSTNLGTNPGGTYYRDQGYSQSFGATGTMRGDRGPSAYYGDPAGSSTYYDDRQMNVQRNTDADRGVTGYYDERGGSVNVDRNVYGRNREDQENWRGLNPLSHPFSFRSSDAASPYPDWDPDQSNVGADRRVTGYYDERDSYVGADRGTTGYYGDRDSYTGTDRRTTGYYDDRDSYRGADRGVTGYYGERDDSLNVGRNADNRGMYSNEAINERAGLDEPEKENWQGLNPLSHPFSFRSSDAASPYPDWDPEQNAPAYYQPTYPRGTYGGQSQYYEGQPRYYEGQPRNYDNTLRDNTLRNE